MEESERDHASAEMDSYVEEQGEQDLQSAGRGQKGSGPGQQEEEEEEEEVYGGDYEDKEEEEDHKEKEAPTIDSDDAPDEDYSNEPKEHDRGRSDGGDKDVGEGLETEDTYSDEDTSSSSESQEPVGQSVGQRRTQAEDNLSAVEYVEALTIGDGRNVKPGSKRAGHRGMSSPRYEHNQHQLHSDMESTRYPQLSRKNFVVAKGTQDILPYIRREAERDDRETLVVDRAQATRAMPTRPKTIPSRWQRPISSTAPWGKRVLGWKELSLAADQERVAVVTRRAEAQQHYSLQGRRLGLRWAQQRRLRDEKMKRDESEHQQWLKLKSKTQLIKQHDRDNQLRVKLLAYFADEPAIRDTLSSRKSTNQPAEQPAEPRVEPKHEPEIQEPRSTSVSAVQGLYARISSCQSPALQRAIHHYSQSTVASIEGLEAQRLDSSRPSTAEYRKNYRLWSAPSSHGIAQSRRDHELLSRELHNTVFRAAQPSGVHHIIEAMSQRAARHNPRRTLGETAMIMDAMDDMDATNARDAVEGLGHMMSEDDKNQHLRSTTPHSTQHVGKQQLGSPKDLEELQSLKQRKRLQGTRGKGSQVRSPRRGKGTEAAMAAAFQSSVVDWDTVVRGWSEKKTAQLQEMLGQIADGEEVVQSHRADGSSVSSHRLQQAQWCFHTLCEKLQMSERQMDVLHLTLPLTPVSPSTIHESAQLMGVRPSHAEYRQLLLYVSVLLKARQRLMQVLEAIEQREGYVRAVNGCKTREGLGDLLLGFQRASTLCLHAIQTLWSAAPWLEQTFLYQNVDYEQKVWHELRILEAQSKSTPGRDAGVLEEEANYVVSR